MTAEAFVIGLILVLIGTLLGLKLSSAAKKGGGE
jgi:hypothetical protein